MSRSIIEKSHGELVDCRRANFSETDVATLVQFKKVIEGNWEKERQQTRRVSPAVWIIIFVAMLFCGLIITIAVSV